MIQGIASMALFPKLDNPAAEDIDYGGEDLENVNSISFTDGSVQTSAPSENTSTSSSTSSGFPFPTVTEYGAVGDGQTDDSDAIEAAIDEATGAEVTGTALDADKHGSAVYFPPGTYRIARTIDVEGHVKFVGAGTGNKSASVIHADDDVTAFRVYHPNTAPSGPGAEWSSFKGLVIAGGGSSKSVHGIHADARIRVEDCYILKSPGDGIHIDTTGGGNANQCQLYWVDMWNCGRHGMYFNGADANAGLTLGCSVRSCGGWGILDSSFLGNTHIAPHATANESGPYKTDEANGRALFIGHYSEANQPPSEFSQHTLSFPGVSGAGETGGFSFTALEGLGSMAIGRRGSPPYPSEGEDGDFFHNHNATVDADGNIVIGWKKINGDWKACKVSTT